MRVLFVARRRGVLAYNRLNAELHYNRYDKFDFNKKDLQSKTAIRRFYHCKLRVFNSVNTIRLPSEQCFRRNYALRFVNRYRRRGGYGVYVRLFYGV